MKRKKLAFCYFSPEYVDYTPTDIGYIVALLEKEQPGKYDCEILKLGYVSSHKEVQGEIVSQEDMLDSDVELIKHHQPEAVFIFCENVLWSKVFALERAKLVSKRIKQQIPEVFIGLQSYKIQENQIQQVLESGAVECIMKDDAENAFLRIDDILKKKCVPGVRCKIMQGRCNENQKHNTTPSGESLDNIIPSPYLNHIFDNYIQSSQLQARGDFRAFLVSSRGCSFRCYYCFRSTKFERTRYFSAKRFYDEVEYLFNSFGVYRFFVLDDAFLCTKQRLQEFEQEFLVRLKSNEKLRDISVFLMARPETIDEEVIEILSKLRVDFIQIGLQTVNPALQCYMGRSIDILRFKKIKDWMRNYKMKLHLDIVIGLPGDSIEWMKETLRFALLLDPYSLQLKQFFLNPNTLFSLKQKEYGIAIEEMPRDFDTPYVIRANGVDEEYFEKTNKFIVSQIEAHPDIFWKYITRKKSFRSRQYYRGE